MWGIPFAHLFAKHQQIFDNTDQIGPDRGFNDGRASGHASATGIWHGVPSRRRRSTADMAMMPSLAFSLQAEFESWLAGSPTSNMCW
jgi:hypothetical protein